MLELEIMIVYREVIVVIMKSYGVITRSYKREREGVGTIGLDWLGIGCGEGCGRGRGMPAGLVPLAWPSPPSIPHSPLPQSFSSPHSTSIWPYLNHIQLHHLILHELHIHHFHLHILFLHIQSLSSPLTSSL